MSNIWLKGSLSTNPYYENAFQIAGLWRDVVDRLLIQTAIVNRKQGLRVMGPEHYPLGRRFLESNDLNLAEDILLDANRRILEELLEHAPEHLPTGQIERFLARLTVPPPVGELTIRHLVFMERVVQALAQELLVNLPVADVPPWPIDLTPITPFGWQGKDEQV
jgi:hypothetical protein